MLGRARLKKTSGCGVSLPRRWGRRGLSGPDESSRQIMRLMRSPALPVWHDIMTCFNNSSTSTGHSGYVYTVEQNHQNASSC